MGLNQNDIICGTCLKAMKKMIAGISMKVEAMDGVQHCDKWKCKHCGHTLYTGFGNEHGFNRVNPDIYIEKTY